MILYPGSFASNGSFDNRMAMAGISLFTFNLKNKYNYQNTKMCCSLQSNKTNITVTSKLLCLVQ